MQKDTERLGKLLISFKESPEECYEEICTLAFDMVYQLVFQLYENEGISTKAAKLILLKACRQADTYAAQEEPYNWIAKFVTKTLYGMYHKEQGELFSYNTGGTEYVYDLLEDDKELSVCAGAYNGIYADRSIEMPGVFRKMTKGQLILYQLFMYEGCSVEEIEDALDEDVLFIVSELGVIRDILLADVQNWTQTVDEPEKKTDEIHNEEPEEVLSFLSDKVIRYLEIGVLAVAVILLVFVVAKAANDRKTGIETANNVNDAVMLEQMTADTDAQKDNLAGGQFHESTALAGTKSMTTAATKAGDNKNETATTAEVSAETAAPGDVENTKLEEQTGKAEQESTSTADTPTAAPAEDEKNPEDETKETKEDETETAAQTKPAQGEQSTENQNQTEHEETQSGEKMTQNNRENPAG